MRPAFVAQPPARLGASRIPDRLRPRLAAGAFALVYLALSTVYASATPIFEKPDEDTHFAYVQHLATGGGLPVQDPGVETLWKQEGSQPPLYYVAASFVTRWFDTSDLERQFEPNASPLYLPIGAGNKNKLLLTPEKRAFAYSGSTLAAFVLRLLNVPLGLLVAASAYGIGSRLAGRPVVGWLAAALAVFNPVFLNVMSAVSNDGLVIVLSAVGMWLLAAIVFGDGSGSIRRYIGLGVLCGLASLAKLSGVMLLLISLGAIALRGLADSRWDLRRALRPVIGRLLAVGVPWLALAGWWFARNFALYGELTGSRRMAEIAGPRALSLPELLTEFQGFRLSYFGILGQFNIPLDGAALVGWEILLVIAAAGLLVRVAFRRREIPLETGRLAITTALAGHAAVVFLGIMLWTSMTHASQGRLAFPAVVSLSLALATGLTAFPGRAGRWLAVAAVTFAASTSLLAPFRNILPAYVPPLVAEIPSDLRPFYQRFGDKAEVVGYAFSPTSMRPGESMRLRLALRALAPTKFNFSLAAVALGRGLTLIGQFSTFTGGGLYPSREWSAGQVWIEELDIPTSATAAAPVESRIELQMVNFGSGEVLPPLDRAGRPGVSLLSGPTLLLAPIPAGPTLGRLGDLVEVTAAEHDYARAGGTLSLTLSYRTLAPSARDLTVFVHVTPATVSAQPPLGQSDGPPMGGEFNTSRWAPGVAFTETRFLALPPNLPEGRYTLRVGLYDPAQGTRVPAFSSNGNRVADDALTLGVIDLGP